MCWSVIEEFLVIFIYIYEYLFLLLGISNHKYYMKFFYYLPLLRAIKEESIAINCDRVYTVV